MKKKRNIKSSKVTLKFSNTGKLDKLNEFRKEYVKTVMAFCDVMWDMTDLKSLADSDTCSKITTNLKSRALQCAGKQASAIVRGTKEKERRRIWKYNDLMSKGMFKKARKLMNYIKEHPAGKPEINEVNPQLDSRFYQINMGCKTSFDGWIRIAQIGLKNPIYLPLKLTKHIKSLEENGYKITNSICLNRDSVTFTYEKVEEVPFVEEGKTIGIDIGIKSVYSVSDGRQSGADIHGHTLDSIVKKLCRKKKDTKAFAKAQAHRRNHINMLLNHLNLNGVKKIRLEGIKNLRKNKRTSKYLSRWTYTDIYGKLKSICKESGVQIQYIDQTYTSQRCSCCGWTRKANRKGTVFKCTSCGYTSDADLNASVNISLDLPPIGKKKRLQKLNRKGFYWEVVRQELIVPVAQEA